MLEVDVLLDEFVQPTLQPIAARAICGCGFEVNERSLVLAGGFQAQRGVTLAIKLPEPGLEHLRRRLGAFVAKDRAELGFLGGWSRHVRLPCLRFPHRSVVCMERLEDSPERWRRRVVSLVAKNRVEAVLSLGGGFVEAR